MSYTAEALSYFVGWEPISLREARGDKKFPLLLLNSGTLFSPGEGEMTSREPRASHSKGSRSFPPSGRQRGAWY